MYPLILPSPGEQLDAAHISRHRGVIHLLIIELYCVSTLTGGLIVLRLQVFIVKIFLQFFVGRERRVLAASARCGGRLPFTGCEPADDDNCEQEEDYEGSGVLATENRAESLSIHGVSPVKLRVRPARAAGLHRI